MGTKKSEEQNPSKFFAATTSVARFCILWLFIILFISLLELLYNSVTHHFRESFFEVLMLAWLNDLVFWFKALLFVYPLFVILHLISPKFMAVIYYVFGVVMVLFQFALSLYFTTALVPLGGDAYSYSAADIRQTVGASGVISFLNIVWIVLLIGITIAVLWFVPKRLKLSLSVVAALPLLIFLIWIFDVQAKITTPDLKSDFANNLILNKADYFWQSSYKHFNPEPHELDIYADNYMADYSKAAVNNGSFKYTDPQQYPFLHGDSVADVLSPFFKNNPQPPNVVIIVVEGLGRAFTNDGAYLGNFTPFIDSLSGKSIYWKNFLSEGGRTFAALPSILGSLPFAKNGFLALGNNMPDHLSLLSLLKYNGYHTSFYYGGDAKFDNMDIFLRKNHVDELNDGKTFPAAGYLKLPAANGFSWGFDDKSLFKHFLVTRNANPPAPQLSIILTVSTHSPFAINDQAKYLAEFEGRMDQLHFTSQQKEEHRDYKLQYASILYLDDALRGFFNSYRQRADYNNTIFLITGDHRMPEIPMSTKIDRYHVPLIVYSPMLTHTAQIESVSTHFDISPSLLAFLRHHYSIQGPSLVSWMGQGLDTSHNFRNVHAYPLMQTKTDIIDFIMGEYHLNEDKLFKLDPKMGEDEVHDDPKLNQLKTAFDEFKKRNDVIVTGNHIIPDSIYAHYGKGKR